MADDRKAPGSVVVQVATDPNGQPAAPLSVQLQLQILGDLAALQADISSQRASLDAIMRDQERATESREKIYNRLGAAELTAQIVTRIAPLTDEHERKIQQFQGGLFLGRMLMVTGGGLIGALMLALLQWVGRKFGG